jgi:hypothetical protein
VSVCGRRVCVNVLCTRPQSRQADIPLSVPWYTILLITTVDHILKVFYAACRREKDENSKPRAQTKLLGRPLGQIRFAWHFLVNS